MEIDLDNIVTEAEGELEKLLPWELTVKVNGKSYAIRPLTNADMGQIAAAETMKEKAIKKMIAGFFASDKPDLEALSYDQLMSLVAAPVNYFQSRIKKKSLIINQRMGAAIRSTSGTSLTP